MAEIPSLTSQQIEKLLAAARGQTAQLVAIEWGEFEPEGYEHRADEVAAEPRTLAKLVESDPNTYDARRAKVRDRYVGVRFAGVARSAADLQDAKRVIKAARLAFEEGHAETALELLELAIEQRPFEKSLWLAELEIAFLTRDAERFVESARAYQAAHPKSAEWAEVERLGRALAPGSDLFSGRGGARAHEHYGPWPHLPNWIQAPWDLTSEVVAADFRRAMLRDGDGDGR
jgi:hypothetical protein